MEWPSRLNGGDSQVYIRAIDYIQSSDIKTSLNTSTTINNNNNMHVSISSTVSCESLHVTSQMFTMKSYAKSQMDSQQISSEKHWANNTHL